MPDVVVISGHPRPGSRTFALAFAVGEIVAERRGRVAPVVVDVAALGPGLLTPGDGPTGTALAVVQDATVLIVASPTCKGSYAGALKVLLDQLPANALAGMVAVPVVTAGVQSQADVSEAFLARLLSELGADVVDFGLTATEPELTDITGLAGQYAEAIGI